ncbi:MAG: AMP-binding protein [Acidimicrobiales bacterium]
MYPGAIAALTPAKTAYVMARSGQEVTYRQLDDRSNQVAQLLWHHGLRPGDGIAIFMENDASYLEVAWAAQRSGLYYTAISSRLTADEVAYIVNDCGARALFTSWDQADVAAQVVELTPKVETRFMVNGTIDGHGSYESARDSMAAKRLKEELEGADLLYSSGTTGRPKGVKVALTGRPAGTPSALLMLTQGLYEFGPDMTYLSPAPLYHAAPLRFTMAVLRLGGTVVIMEHFDPEDYLNCVSRFSVTHSQVVPTMFVRMLKLDPVIRQKADTSSLRVVVHAAAPCPVPIKREMIDWWGPVIYEYYAGTEGNGFVAIDSPQWLEHPGSVGRALSGVVHIVGETGEEMGVGEPGTIYFEGGGTFEYHNDPDKTASSRNAQGWSTLGDIGYLDAQGYLYLTDRKAFMIISGGINIYPQEAENLLVTHPKVMDVAVFGVPNDDFGEEVKAVVQPLDWADAGPELERELIGFCHQHLAGFKCPRSIDFQIELPRHPTGKLYKRLLKDRYWTDHASQIV